MIELRITETNAVQFPMVRHAAEVGWMLLSPRDVLVLRGGEAGLSGRRLKVPDSSLPVSE